MGRRGIMMKKNCIYVAIMVLVTAFSLLVCPTNVQAAGIRPAGESSANAKTVQTDKNHPAGGVLESVGVYQENVNAPKNETKYSVVQDYINSGEASVFERGASTYGYSTLNANQKTYYNRIKSQVDSFLASNKDLPTSSARSSNYGYYYPVTEVSFSGLGLSVGEAFEAYRCFDYDHPGYYWISNMYLYSNSSITICTDADYRTAAARNKIDNLIVSGMKDYENLAASTDDTLEKIALVHDKICHDVKYAYYSGTTTPRNEKWAHSVHGVFDPDYHEVVCEGYSDAFSFIMNYLDIPNRYIIGGAYSGNASLGAHAWNEVSSDDGETFMYMDVTWDDHDDGTFDYKHFGMPKSDFETEHKKYYPRGYTTVIDDYWMYPINDTILDTFEGTYYYKSGLYYSGEGDVNAFVSSVVRKGNMFSDTVTCLTTADQLSRLGQALFEGQSYYYGTITYKKVPYYTLSFIRETTISLTDSMVTLSPDTFIYDGTAKRPEVKVNAYGKILTEGVDYTVEYSNNINISTANAAKPTVTVTGMGDYEGTVSKTFKIIDSSEMQAQEEARKAAEEAAKKRAEEEARRKAEEEARRKAWEEANKQTTSESGSYEQGQDGESSTGTTGSTSYTYSYTYSSSSSSSSSSSVTSWSYSNGKIVARNNAGKKIKQTGVFTWNGTNVLLVNGALYKGNTFYMDKRDGKWKYFVGGVQPKSGDMFVYQYGRLLRVKNGEFCRESGFLRYNGRFVFSYNGAAATFYTGWVKYRGYKCYLVKGVLTRITR